MVAQDETLLGLFPETKTEIVAREGERDDRARTTPRSGARAWPPSTSPSSRAATSASRRSATAASGASCGHASRFDGAARRTRVRIEMEGRTKALVPEFTIRGPMQDQLDQMASALRERLEAKPG